MKQNEGQLTKDEFLFFFTHCSKIEASIYNCFFGRLLMGR